MRGRINVAIFTDERVFTNERSSIYGVICRVFTNERSSIYGVICLFYNITLLLCIDYLFVLLPRVPRTSSVTKPRDGACTRWWNEPWSLCRRAVYYGLMGYMTIAIIYTELIQNIHASFNFGHQLTQLKQRTTHFRHESLHVRQGRFYFRGN